MSTFYSNKRNQIAALALFLVSFVFLGISVLLFLKSRENWVVFIPFGPLILLALVGAIFLQNRNKNLSVTVTHDALIFESIRGKITLPFSSITSYSFGNFRRVYVGQAGISAFAIHGIQKVAKGKLGDSIYNVVSVLILNTSDGKKYRIGSQYRSSRECVSLILQKIDPLIIKNVNAVWQTSKCVAFGPVTLLPDRVDINKQSFVFNPKTKFFVRKGYFFAGENKNKYRKVRMFDIPNFNCFLNMLINIRGRNLDPPFPEPKLKQVYVFLVLSVITIGTGFLTYYYGKPLHDISALYFMGGIGSIGIVGSLLVWFKEIRKKNEF